MNKIKLWFRKVLRKYIYKGLKIHFYSTENDNVYEFFKDDIKKCRTRHLKYNGDDEVYVCLVKHTDINNVLPKKLSNKYELTIFFKDFFDKKRIKVAKEYLFPGDYDTIIKIAREINAYVDRRYGFDIKEEEE